MINFSWLVNNRTQMLVFSVARCLAVMGLRMGRHWPMLGLGLEAEAVSPEQAGEAVAVRQCLCPRLMPGHCLTTQSQPSQEVLSSHAGPAIINHSHLIQISNEFSITLTLMFFWFYLTSHFSALSGLHAVSPLGHSVSAHHPNIGA